MSLSVLRSVYGVALPESKEKGVVRASPILQLRESDTLEQQFNRYGRDIMDAEPPRLKTGIWVQAQVRHCDRACIPLAIMNKGDADAGSVLLKIFKGRDDCRVYSRAFSLDGVLGWLCGTGNAPVDEATADAFIKKRLAFDRDLWVLEIEDLKGLYELDAPIIE